MIYRPKDSSMWDSWIFEWKGKFHLFYLDTHEECWDHIGHAISDDLLRWETLAPLRTKGKPGTWNEGVTLTGMVVAHKDLFYMFAGSVSKKGPHQSIEIVGVYVSDDLENWKTHEASPVMLPAAPHYLAEPPAQIFPKTVNWRDPCITFRPEDGYYHALICAALPTRSHKHLGAAIGHLKSKDLIHWEHLPPIDAPLEKFFHAEVPDFFELNGKYYIIFSTISLDGIRLNTTSRKNAVGTFYLVSDSPDGPYKLPEDYLLIGTANSKLASYVGRTIPYQGERLLYHITKSGENTAWGMPKMVRQRKDKTLYLAYMPMMKNLETSVLCTLVSQITEIATPDPGDWSCQDNQIIAKAMAVGSGCKIWKNIADFHLECIINASSAARVGLVLRVKENEESGKEQGVMIGLDYENQCLEIERVDHGFGLGWGVSFTRVVAGRGNVPYDTCKLSLKYDREYRLRCFARNEFFEVFLDDAWVFTCPLPQAAKQGNISLFVERGEAIFTDLRIAAIEPLA